VTSSETRRPQPYRVSNMASAFTFGSAQINGGNQCVYFGDR
jgi:hypothetical protein